MTAHSTTLHYKSEEWFSSYLNNRIQSTQMVPHISNIANVSCGVPQGSLLGLLRFYCIWMTRDCSNKLKFYFLADDGWFSWTHTKYKPLNKNEFALINKGSFMPLYIFRNPSRKQKIWWIHGKIKIQCILIYRFRRYTHYHFSANPPTQLAKFTRREFIGFWTWVRRSVSNKSYFLFCLFCLAVLCLI